MLQSFLLKGSILIINSLIIKQLEKPIINLGKIIITECIPQVLNAAYKKIKGENIVRYF